MLADLDSAVKQRDAAVKRARGNDKDARDRLAILEPVIAALEAGRPARSVALSEDQRPLFRQLQLLSAKPVLYAANVDEDSAATGKRYSALVDERAREAGGLCGVVSADIRAGGAALGAPAGKRGSPGDPGVGATATARVHRS